MRDSTVSKNNIDVPASPRVNVITTAQSIVVLVLAGGESAGFSSYSCPPYSRSVDRKDVPSKY